MVASDLLPLDKQDEHVAELAHFLATRSFDDLPDDTIEQARLLVLDILGVALVGSTMEVAPSVVSTFSALGASTDAYTFGNAARSSAFTAALVNATLVHQVELGEGVHGAAVHTSSAVVPAALSVAEREHASGRQLLAAVVVGCEALLRYGYALATDPANDRRHVGDNAVAWLKGWMTPSLLAPFGSATSATFLRGGDAAALGNAWGLAANFAPATSNTVLREGITGKGACLGVGCAVGVLAADLAMAGVSGLRGLSSAWMPLIADAHDPRMLTDRLGEDYRIGRLLFKHFAVVGALFPALEAIFAIIAARPDLSHLDIADVVVEGYGRTMFNAPDEFPSTVEGAKANLRYCVAVAIVTKRREALIAEAFTEAMLHDDRVRAVASRITARLNRDYADRYPAEAELGSVTVTLQDGTVLTEEIDIRQVRRYQNPTFADIEEKFRRTAAIAALSPDATDRVVEAVHGLENLTDVNELTDQLPAH